MANEDGKEINMVHTALVLGTAAHASSIISEILPEYQVIFAEGELSWEGDGLVAQLWERSICFEAILAQDTLPSQELVSFLKPQAQILVALDLAKGGTWQEFLEIALLEERGIVVRVLG